MEVSQDPPRLVVAAAAVWLSRAAILLQRRSASARHGAGRLEFPGGKLERGEAPAAALRRELVEEWGPGAARLRVGAIADVLHHVYPAPGPEILLLVYHVDAAAWGEDGWADAVVLEAGTRVECYAPRDLPIPDFLAADHPFAERIARGEVTAPPGWA